MIIKFTNQHIDAISSKTKFHTFELNKKEWKIGKKIDGRMENNQRYYNPLITAIQTTDVAIKKIGDRYEAVYFLIDKNTPDVSIADIAKNEGYDNERELLEALFNKATDEIRTDLHIFRGKILHWTEIKY